jgi:hypothetical protein
MAAVRVPPSAWITSQSRITVRSPRAFMSTTERRLRPIRRWISWVRPPILPRSLSRGVRVTVERGSMAYSAVTQPRPELRSQPGTPCSMVALVRTRVLPSETSTEPSAVWTKPGVRESGRSWPGVRPPGRKKGSAPGAWPETWTEVWLGACIGRLYGRGSWWGVVSRFRAGPRTGILRFGGPKQEGLANRLNLNRLGGRDATVLSHIGTISSQSVWSGCPDFGQ